MHPAIELEDLFDSELLDTSIDESVLCVPDTDWGLRLLEPARHKLLCALMVEPKRVADLVQELDRSAASIAAELAELEELGVVFSRLVNLGGGERTPFFRAWAGRLELAATVH